MAAIQLGISHSLAKLHPKPKRDLLVPDFRSVDNMEFPAAGSDNTPGHTYSDFNFKAYSPIAFRHLRDHFTIAPEDFLSSLCYFPLRAIGNPGASGSLFYVSQDDLFIIKTVSSKEALFLQKLLPGYWINLHQNKRTLLPKFFGLYSYNKKGTTKIRLVVMNNLLPSNIEFHLKFDLKGSSHGRNASSRELSKNHPTFKDNDFLTRVENGIVISPEKYELLAETIQRDCQVLESFAIMDYSLLVAVHNISKIRSEYFSPPTDVFSLPAEQRSTATLRLSMSLDETDLIDKKSLAIVPSSQIDSQTHEYIKSLPEGYFLARLPNQDLAAVYLGIIDILQSYVTKKKLEHTFKAIVYDGDLVSVHKPNFYSKRFQSFMCTNVFTKDPNMRDSKSGVIPQIGARRKNKRSSIGGRPVIIRSQSSEYSITPPSYQLENDQTESTKVSNFSTTDYSLRIPHEDELIRYSQLDLEQETPQKDLFQASEDEICDKTTKQDDNISLSTHTFSSVGVTILKNV
eukprot:TRINITY_DN98_c0_g4_i1.p1 TRINITY_DN98_c0_g4~~TRINITY_DN98_c0_g4_i1.p1  ORF type:complete len:600 (-),score=23.74 TRINITY_DN98_c0_g4_i1:116-1657(-)